MSPLSLSASATASLGKVRRSAAPGLLSNHLTSTTAGAPELRYPGTLDNTERRFIHNLCGKLGLFSKSYGSKYVAAARPVGLHVGVASRDPFLPGK